MKIGVITFFGNGNYGSELQALAMQGFCKSRGHEVTFLRIYSSNKYIRICKRIKDRILIKIKCYLDDEYRRYYHDRKNNANKQRAISTDLFKHISTSVNKYINMSNISQSGLKKSRLYDCYICGSDQVWSALRIPVWKENFLGDVSPMRKIAYAPSIGVNEVPNYYIHAVAPLIRDFKFLSVREQSAAEIFRKRIGVDPFVAVDPTILVGKKYWLDLLQKEQLPKPECSYIFCYFLGELNDEQVDSLNRFAGDRKIIILPYEKHAERLNNANYILADHLEFVNYIRYADYVFTDSFHATVFSILFHREFAVFQRSHVGVSKQTSRIESLLSLVQLDDHLVNNPNAVESFSDTNYDKVDEIIEKERQKSIEFLDNALTHIQNKLK